MDSDVLAEERLLGSKIPISRSSLNRDYGLDMSASQKCINELYQKNRDVLNAYTCEASTSVAGHLKTIKLSLKLCPPDPEPESISLLSPKGQALTYAYSACYNNMSTTRKKHTAGIPIPNPMMAHSDKTPPAPEEAAKAEPPAKIEAPKAKALIKTEDLSSEAAKPISREVLQQQAAQPKKPAAKTKPAGPWKTLSKEEARAQALKKSAPVVSEKVVIAEHSGDVQESQPEEAKKDLEARKKQLESLNNLFDQDNDAEMEVDAEDQSDEDAMDLDSEDHDEPIVDEPIVDEPIVEEPIVDEPIVDEPIVDEAAMDVPEPGPEVKVESSQTTGPVVQNKRLVEEIRHKEEDGMTVSYKVKVWRDVSTGEEVAEPAGSRTGHSNAKSAAPKAKSESTPKQAKPPAKKPAASRGGGKQQTQQKKLTSFFKK